jgi:HprK-related kinase A
VWSNQNLHAAHLISQSALSDIQPASLRSKARKSGIRFTAGPFTLSVRTRHQLLINHLALMYADSQVCSADAFIDFHTKVRSANPLRRFIKPATVFAMGDTEPFKPLPAAQVAAQFEWGLNWCISEHAHQFLIIHAAVVERNGRALILPGAPGSGKSTLCADLVSSGWRLLSDEMALIDVKTTQLVPIPRPISLKNQSIDIIRERHPHAVLSESIPDTSKGDLAHCKAPAASVLAAAQRVDDYDVVYPTYRATADTPELRPVSKAESCMQLIANTFNFSVHGEQGFDLITRVTDRASHHSLAYRSLDDANAAIRSIRI